MFSVFSRSVSRVTQATLVLFLLIPSLLPLLPGANAAPTSNPSAPVTPQLDSRAQGPKRSSRLPVPALLAIFGVSLTVLLLGVTLVYIYVRRRRVHQKRTEHRVRAAQFQEMHRSGARPYYAGGNAPIVVSLPLPGSAQEGEKRGMMGPRYPTKAYVM